MALVASMVLLPLMLPSLPPLPLVLLFFPVGIMALMLLTFSPSKVDRNVVVYTVQDCLGALDGTYVKVNVLKADKPRYRSRKGEIATNVLGVCAPDMQFIYVLSGWEGSIADSRVLRSAITRTNGLKVPEGKVQLPPARRAPAFLEKLRCLAIMTVGVVNS
ncbi:protein ALP1-like [Senna tora]|uniref:Protein ALP1-like n=1 Tax=Senna tora TaxID=362788 RepID=A0A834WMQ3_9FABA|nr:protein ALP1-like [Senna tora]